MVKGLIKIYLVCLVFLSASSCEQSKDPIPIEEIIPWCIVSFDALERSPSDRIDMLRELGITSYGYNWKEKHLKYMEDEFQLAQQNNIEIPSIFLWLNAKRDSIGKLSPLNERLFDVLSKVKNKPVIYVSFSDNFFNDLSHDESLDLALQFITFVYQKAKSIGCEIALYNHHGWFGNPLNQIELIKIFKEDSLRMVYNFHHAHDFVQDFSDLVPKISPYIDYITLNGMKSAEEKIYTLGKGDYEYEMIKIFLDNGYEGKWGILGHIREADVEVVLKQNIEGLKQINKNLKAEGY